MRKMLIALVALLTALPAVGFAASVDELQQQLNDLQQQIEDMSARVDSSEKKGSTDRINWYGDFRTKADTLHYQDVTWNPGAAVNLTNFFNGVGAALNPLAPHPLGDMNVFVPDALSPLGVSFDPTASAGTPLDEMFVNMATNHPDVFQSLMQQMGSYMLAGQAPGVGYVPMLPAKATVGDINNDILYTTRLRLGMKAKVADNVDFSGRLSMYKNWGDSTGVKVFDSWNAFTMDGTDGGNTTGDFLRVERAYFDWRDIGGSDFYLSIGRRPSTYGPPGQYRENEMRGGTPSGHLVNFNFDGITAGYKLSEATGIEGQTIRFCYGQGFESQYGNGELFNNTTTKDTHLGGINFDIVNDGTNFVQLTAFAAQDVVDGFKGTFAFPTQYAELFAPTMYQDMQNFPNMNFVTRYQPSTDIGDMKLVGLGAAREEENGLNYFASFGWTRLEPNGKAGMFGGMGSDMVYQAEGLDTDGDAVVDTIAMMPTGKTKSSDDEDGYGVYAGVQIPAPAGKFGLEYNYGSKFWTPFTQAQDDILGSKLAVRGHVGEAYYIVDVNENMFIKLGGLYYDYQYTGSGSPVGEPQKVKDVLAGTAYSMMPVADTAWDAYASLTVKF